MICSVLLLTALQASTTPTDGMSVAIVPVAGERVSLEEVPLFERLDAALRGAAATAGVKLQAAAATRAQLAAVRDSGIDCDLSDGLCLGKVAVLAEVDRLLVPIARREGNIFHVRMLVVDGASKSREVRGDVSLTDDELANRASARALIDSGMAVVLTEADRPQLATTETAPAPAASAPVAAAPWTGVALMGTAGALAVGGTVGAIVFDALLATPEPYQARQGKMAAGQACIVAAAAGAVGVAVGALLFALGK